MIGFICFIMIGIIWFFLISIITEKKHRENVIQYTHAIMSNSGNNISLCNNSIVAFVERVIDGDTIVIQGGKRIRFANIDAYESNSPIHSQIMNYIVPLIQGQYVKIAITGSDKYNRLIGTIYTLDGKNVNYELVKKGYAVVYDNYCDKSSPEYRALKEAEKTAMIYRLGGYGMLLNRPEFDRHNYN